MHRQRSRYRSTYRYNALEETCDSYSREAEWTEYNRSENTVFSPRDDNNSAFQVKGSRTPIRSWEIYKVKRGDHIGWHRPIGIYWHHAIVAEVDEYNRRLLVIHFTKKNGSIKICKEWIDAEKQKGELFRFDYSSDILRNNSTDIVMERAHALLDRRNYGLFKNNCEHFATYCKTGIKESAQARWVAGKLRETAATTAVNVGKSAVRLGCDVAKEVTKQSYTSMAAGGGKVAAAEGIEFVGKATNWVGAGLVVGFEAAHCTYDICRLRKARKAGKMTRQDYNRTITQRVSEGAFGAAGAIGGGLLGGFLGSFLPGVGTAVGAFIGNVVGGFVGSVVGKAVGSIFGRWFGKKLW